MRYFLIPLLIINYGLFAQQQKIDSLNSLLVISRDNPKVDIFLALAEQYDYLNDKKAITFAKQANNLASQLAYKEGEIRSFYEMGRVIYKQRKNSKALIYFEQGMELAKVVNDQSLIALGYMVMSKYYIHENNFPKALEYINSSLTIYTNLDQKKDIPL